jgi:hypothetical protein
MAAVEKPAYLGERRLFPKRNEIFEIFALKSDYRFQPKAGLLWASIFTSPEENSARFTF